MFELLLYIITRNRENLCQLVMYGIYIKLSVYNSCENIFVIDSNIYERQSEILSLQDV